MVSETTSLLDTLPVGASAIVRSVDCGRLVRRRLLELGLLPGTHLEVIRRAPLGDPLELSLRGYHLSIRAEEARAICVGGVTSAARVGSEARVGGDAPAAQPLAKRA